MLFNGYIASYLLGSILASCWVSLVLKLGGLTISTSEQEGKGDTVQEAVFLLVPAVSINNRSLLLNFRTKFKTEAAELGVIKVALQ